MLLIAPLHSFSNEVNEVKLRLSMKQLGGSERLFNEWQNIIKTSEDLAVTTKLQRINQFFNQKIQFTDDQENWGQSDYWATILETLSKEKGDCEDYVIAKYFSLLRLNINDSQLRLVYVKARIGGMNSSIQQAHMVLAYYPSADSEPFILDNLISEIRPASKRPDLTPIFSFNSQGIFASTNAKANVTQGGTSRLSRWQDLLNRSRKEGFE